MARFAGKTIVITGGSSGIGLATALRVVEEGGRVLVTGTSPDKLAAVRSDAVQVLVNDAADPAAVAAFLLSDEAGFVTGSDYAVDGGEAQL